MTTSIHIVPLHSPHPSPFSSCIRTDISPEDRVGLLVESFLESNKASSQHSIEAFARFFEALQVRCVAPSRVLLFVMYHRVCARICPLEQPVGAMLCPLCYLHLTPAVLEHVRSFWQSLPSAVVTIQGWLVSANVRYAECTDLLDELFTLTHRLYPAMTS